MTEQTKCGYIAIVGRPNVGKSTLLNCLLGKKISITSKKPQTTRHQILGIKTKDNIQAIYIDTPGIHKLEKFALNRYLNRLASSVIPDADVVVFMIEALQWQEEDELVLNKIRLATSPVILVINKVDTVKDKAQLLPFIDELKAKYDFSSIIPISAIRLDNNVAILEEKIAKTLPAGVPLFQSGEVTDKSKHFQVAELIREKIIHVTEQEIPYSTSVEIESFAETEKLVEIGAIIWVEREGQKPIVIGAKGERLKKIGTLARQEIEKLLQQKVFLRLWVKVKDKWTNDDRALRSLGYE